MPYVLRNFCLREFGLILEVEDLDDGVGSLFGPQHNDGSRSMHHDPGGGHRHPFEKKVLARINNCTIGRLSDANEFLALESQTACLEELLVEAKRPEIKQLSDRERHLLRFTIFICEVVYRAFRRLCLPLRSTRR